MAYPRHRLARAHKFVTRTSGDLTLNSTSWADLPGVGTSLDIVLAAQVGDTIEVGVSMALGGNTVYSFMNVATIVAAAVVNYVIAVPSSSSGAGVKAWQQTGNVASDAGLGGSVMYTLVAGDISAGTVTLRPRYRTGTAANKTLNGTAADPFHFWAKNLGPQDPN